MIRALEYGHHVVFYLDSKVNYSNSSIALLCFIQNRKLDIHHIILQSFLTLINLNQNHTYQLFLALHIGIDQQRTVAIIVHFFWAYRNLSRFFLPLILLMFGIYRKCHTHRNEWDSWRCHNGVFQRPFVKLKKRKINMRLLHVRVIISEIIQMSTTTRNQRRNSRQLKIPMIKQK